jgi:hypothetical protein
MLYQFSFWFPTMFFFGVVHAVVIAQLCTVNFIAIYSFSLFFPSPKLICDQQDADGATVWICPACGKVDDGTPMIGCDACDAWYHW